MTPSPALPLKGKGDQPHKPQQQPVRWPVLPLEGELEGVCDFNHFTQSLIKQLNSYIFFLLKIYSREARILFLVRRYP